MELRVIIAGSRDFNDFTKLKRECSELISAKTKSVEVESIQIICGGARGADRLGEQYAKESKLEVKRFIPNWDAYGKSAGYIRNTEMAKYASEGGNVGMLIAFWDGNSRGTKHMIDLAKRYGLGLHVIKY